MSAGRRAQQFKTSLMSHFEIYTGPSQGSALQICCTRRGRQGTNFIDVGATVLSVDTFTAGVSWQEGGSSKSPLVGGAVGLHIDRYFRLVWGVLARREMRSRRPKSKIASSAVSRRMKPR